MQCLGVKDTQHTVRDCSSENQLPDNGNMRQNAAGDCAVYRETTEMLFEQFDIAAIVTDGPSSAAAILGCLLALLRY